MEAGEGLPFDVLAFRSGTPIRIQAKSTQGLNRSKQYSFIAAKGKYAKKGASCPLVNYTKKEIDFLACAALSLDKVLFIPITKVKTARINIDPAEFEKPDATKTSFLNGLKVLKIS